jgi:transglutaminase-like putative cysteine protease
MYLTTHHTTTYTYSKPAWDSFNALWLRPADDYRQTLLSFDVIVEPNAVLRSQLDFRGNTNHHFHVPEKHNKLVIEANSTVVTYSIPYPQAVFSGVLPSLRHRFFNYLAPTERVPLNVDWFEVFGALRLKSQDNLVIFLMELTQYLQTRFTYDPSSTNVETPLATFADIGAGVCQDFTHAMLALCRIANIPVRYVSGYIHSNPQGDETLIGAEGSHAWLEAFLPGSGWVGFDPTNGCLVTEAHIKVACGRDYSDVPPIRGLHRGGGDSDLTVDVQVRFQEDDSSWVVASRE